MTETEIASLRAAFRGDIQENPTFGFDRDRQLQISANRLSSLRAQYPKEWRLVYETLPLARRDGPDHRGVREFRLRIEKEIRWADESSDHRRTVWFVSLKAVRRMIEEGQGTFGIGQINSSALGHEHSVPVDVILRIVVDPQNDHADLLEILSTLSQRALLHCDEVSQIDRKHGTSLPMTVETRRFLSVGLRVLPMRVFGLARYHAAVPTLIEDLVPLNSRAEGILSEFRGILERGYPIQQEPNLCFLPDCVVP